ncbi:hypothetical protein ACE6H2_003475 [Prunus campanulata]
MVGLAQNPSRNGVFCHTYKKEKERFPNIFYIGIYLLYLPRRLSRLRLTTITCPNAKPSPLMHPHRRRLPTTTLRTLTIDSAAAMVPESVVLIRRFLLFVAVCLSCLLLYNDSNALRFLPRFSSSPSVLFSAYNSALVSGEHRLQKVLKDAAMEDGTVILTTLNEAWAAPNSIIDLFLESFKIGVGTHRLLNHLDADVMWFRDPFPQFYMDADFQIACDHFLGNSDDLENRPNGGFNYVKSNNRSIEFYKFWYSSREAYPGFHDQDVLNIIKFHPSTFTIGLRMKFLDTAYFGGFCEPSKDFNQVCTMHANCCYGLDSKLHDLRIMLQNWKQFMSLRPNLKKYLILPWGVPQNCSLDSLRRYDAPESSNPHDLQD